jgi:hypothetical protein
MTGLRVVRIQDDGLGFVVARKNRRSLHCAPPDFLSRLVALIVCLRLSLRRAANVVVAGSAMQEIRVRFGRDDKG